MPRRAALQHTGADTQTHSRRANAFFFPTTFLHIDLQQTTERLSNPSFAVALCDMLALQTPCSVLALSLALTQFPPKPCHPDRILAPLARSSQLFCLFLGWFVLYVASEMSPLKQALTLILMIPVTFAFPLLFVVLLPSAHSYRSSD